MASKKKCVICGEPIDESQGSPIPYKNRYAHDKCFCIAMKAIKKDKDDKLEKKANNTKKKCAKPKVELKDAVSEEDYADKKQYYQYLRQLIGEELSAKIYALSDSYINRYGFTFKQMYQTLTYMQEIIEKKLVGDIVGLIPYYYTEAQEYYESVELVKNANNNIDINTMYQEKVIKIRPQRKSLKQLDITTITEEE